MQITFIEALSIPNRPATPRVDHSYFEIHVPTQDTAQVPPLPGRPLAILLSLFPLFRGDLEGVREKSRLICSPIGENLESTGARQPYPGLSDCGSSWTSPR